MLSYQHTPVQEIEDRVLDAAGVRLLVKREDCNHPKVSGNKWWKLKYNLAEVVRNKHTAVLTFGGAYSNHIYAVAAAAKEIGLESIGIIRGEETPPLNATISFVKECGMQLHYISRAVYRRKTEDAFIENLHKQFGDFYLIPEGGTNALALKGCEEFARDILSEINFDYLCLPVGTGGTMAGLVMGLEGKKKVIGFSSLKGGAFLEDEIKTMLMGHASGKVKSWSIETAYHFGGYGKNTKSLENFISSQWQNHHVPLDPVYTSKTMFGVYDMVMKSKFKRGSTILLLHTGGLQGRKF